MFSNLLTVISVENFLYPLKDYNMNLQPTLLYKITVPYSYTILLETIPRGAKDYVACGQAFFRPVHRLKTMTTPRPIEHRD